MLQEEAMRHSDHEHNQLVDRVSSLERTVGVLETDKQQLHVSDASSNNSLVVID